MGKVVVIIIIYIKYVTDSVRSHVTTYSEERTEFMDKARDTAIAKPEEIINFVESVAEYVSDSGITNHAYRKQEEELRREQKQPKCKEYENIARKSSRRVRKSVRKSRKVIIILTRKS